MYLAGGSIHGSGILPPPSSLCFISFVLLLEYVGESLRALALLTEKMARNLWRPSKPPLLQQSQRLAYHVVAQFSIEC